LSIGFTRSSGITKERKSGKKGVRNCARQKKKKNPPQKPPPKTPQTLESPSAEKKRPWEAYPKHEWRKGRKGIAKRGKGGKVFQGNIDK